MEIFKILRIEKITFKNKVRGFMLPDYILITQVEELTECGSGIKEKVMDTTNRKLNLMYTYTTCKFLTRGPMDNKRLSQIGFKNETSIYTK